MSLHLFVYLLVVCLLLSLALLWLLDWLPLQPTHSRGRAIHSLAQRLLKPRTPLDCPACRLPCTHSSVVRTGPLLVQPRERGGKLLTQRYRQRTPAMAAGRTIRRWTAREVLSCPLPKLSA